ncbi:MAG: DUF3488 and transglutaminase-like domain-containing protein [Halothiobacillus sp.]|jgi:transglutaminase-like putative cysteine protease|nr:DUF3488 and transglutaminase-like domain-containing protein [Halothiobacillus sp.]
MNNKIQPLDRPLGIVIALAIAAHLPHMPIWAIPLVLLGLIWRLQHEWRGWPLPTQPLLILLAMVFSLLVLFTYHSLWGRDPGVTLLTLGALLKLLETRQLRDQFALLLLGFFLIVSLLLFDQGIFTALISLGLFAGLVTAWIGLSNPNIRLIKPRIKAASGLMLAGLPIALLFFLLFPRPPGALWGTKQPTTAQARTGLSDQLTAGEFERLSTDPTPAFRVHFNGAMIPPAKRYWRVLVMSDETSNTWHADIPNIFRPVRSPNVRVDPTSAVEYTVTLEPSDRRFLPTLAIATVLPPRSVLSDTGSLFSLRPLNDRYRYTVTSALSYHLDERRLSASIRERNLALPAGDPELKALAAQWKGLAPLEIRDRALNYFRSQGFSYTLTPGKLPEQNRMDAFLFDTKRGYCEHYASAFTLLMRAAGVPARIVTGYQGGEVNGDYLLVRQADAHAWSEIWVKGEGWIRVDPTQTVAPERITDGIAQAAQQDAALPAALRRDDSLARQWSLLGDRVENGWNQYVLGYSGSTQTDLMQWFGLEKLGQWGRLGFAFIIVAIAWLMIFGLWRHLGRPEKNMPPVDRAWFAVSNELSRLGITRQPSETLQAYCRRAEQSLPDYAATIRQTQQLISQWRYASCFSQRSQALAEKTAQNLSLQLKWFRWRENLFPGRKRN